MISYEFKDNEVFYVTFIDLVTAKDINDYLVAFEQFTSLPTDLLLLYDLRKAKLKIDIDEVDEVIRLAKKATTKYKSIRTALVVSNPKDTALTILFKSGKSNEKTIRNVFSTIEAANNWLKSN